MPTKQNALCNERSVWQVMRDHRDFTPSISTDANANESTTDETISTPSTTTTTPTSTAAAGAFKVPQFEYLNERSSSERRYVLVIDRQLHWPIIRRSLYCWIHSLANGTYLSVFVSDQRLASLSWTRVTADNRDGLFGRLPRRNVAAFNNNNNFTASLHLAKEVIHYFSSSFVAPLLR